MDVCYVSNYSPPLYQLSYRGCLAISVRRIDLNQSRQKVKEAQLSHKNPNVKATVSVV